MERWFAFLKETLLLRKCIGSVSFSAFVVSFKTVSEMQAEYLFLPVICYNSDTILM